MGLAEYNRKRDFGRTAEPRGAEHRSGDVLAFVIQKHAASHLHYDFRLELDGVLLSWAVPKGPSLDPSVRRLAVHVEDHPVEYGDFEGVIPRGEYGGGTVMLWDRGAWEPRGIDPRAGYRKGDLKFYLHGEKLRGAWHLVRSRRAGDDGGKEQWLLFKDKDEEARPESEGVITEEEPLSVKTGRSMEEIAADRDATWHSNRPPQDAKTMKAQLAAVARAAREKAAESRSAPKRAAKTVASTAGADAGDPASIPGARKAKMPAELLPELATLVDDVPAGDGWLHEIKYDGYRLVVRIDRGEVRILTRKANDWTGLFPGLVPAFAALPAKQAILDGELVVLAPNGTTSFQLLQNAIHAEDQDDLVFYCFDLLYLDGYDLRGAQLLDRKEALRALLAGTDAGGQVRFSDHVLGHGATFHDQACRMGLEGIIAKRADSRYVSKRTKDWLKIKCMRRQEFVIGGYTDPKGSRSGFGALLLGVYEGNRLMHVGKVGTGFDDTLLRTLHRRLAKLETEESPFANLKRRPRDVHWVRPELVGEVAFTEWTGEGILRHPAFQGLREDKSAREVVREEPIAPPPSPAPEETDDSPRAASKAKSAGGARKASVSPPPSTRSHRGRKGEAVAEVAGVRLSSPDKPLFREKGITKLDLARYYEEIADWMLPHVASRPLTLVRCPEGVPGECFYQKHGDQHFIPEIGRVQITENDGDVKTYTYVDSAQGLVGMVQMGVLELHTSNAKIDDFEKPDRFIMDLDPAPDVPWARVVESAFEVRDRLAELGLQSWVKTTGGKGLHVAVPLARRHTWDEVKDFSRALAVDLSARHYGKYITKATIAKRKGKIFLDYLRNGRGATAISAFCIRARPSAAISVPLGWDELTPKLRSDDFTPDAVIRRLGKLRKDPWADFFKSRQSITKKMREALGMKG
ncbi:MAG TPA: DNA ligase D [Longimicrobium sp.]|jgi:bifunctional non-homologous end joining protein LigD